MSTDKLFLLSSSAGLIRIQISVPISLLLLIPKYRPPAASWDSAKLLVFQSLRERIVHDSVAYSDRALFDSGSEAIFVSERLFNTIELHCKGTCALISGMNN